MSKNVIPNILDVKEVEEFLLLNSNFYLSQERTTYLRRRTAVANYPYLAPRSSEFSTDSSMPSSTLLPSPEWPHQNPSATLQSPS